MKSSYVFADCDRVSGMVRPLNLWELGEQILQQPFQSQPAVPFVYSEFA